MSIVHYIANSVAWRKWSVDPPRHPTARNHLPRKWNPWSTHFRHQAGPHRMTRVGRWTDLKPQSQSERPWSTAEGDWSGRSSGVCQDCEGAALRRCGVAGKALRYAPTRAAAHAWSLPAPAIHLGHMPFHAARAAPSTRELARPHAAASRNHARTPAPSRANMRGVAVPRAIHERALGCHHKALDQPTSRMACELSWLSL